MFVEARCTPSGALGRSSLQSVVGALVTACQLGVEIHFCSDSTALARDGRAHAITFR